MTDKEEELARRVEVLEENLREALTAIEKASTWFDSSFSESEFELNADISDVSAELFVTAYSIRRLLS